MWSVVYLESASSVRSPFRLIRMGGLRGGSEMGDDGGMMEEMRLRDSISGMFVGVSVGYFGGEECPLARTR